MTTAFDTIIPVDEAARIDVVRRYEILDTPPDGAFDRITALAARLFGVPIAIVSIVDSDRIWFKSHHGLPDVAEIGREAGLCASAILEAGPRIVNDAAIDPRTMANPLVASSFGLRFYAGVPLTTHDGYSLGTLCVIDRAPRAVTPDQMANLQDLAELVMDQLELRLAARRTIAREEGLRHVAEELADALQASLLPPRPPDLPGWSSPPGTWRGSKGSRSGGISSTSSAWPPTTGASCWATPAGREPGRRRWLLWPAGRSGRRRSITSTRVTCFAT